MAFVLPCTGGQQSPSRQSSAQERKFFPLEPITLCCPGERQDSSQELPGASRDAQLYRALTPQTELQGEGQNKSPK